MYGTRFDPSCLLWRLRGHVTPPPLAQERSSNDPCPPPAPDMHKDPNLTFPQQLYL